jgi:hypothetical protein
MGGPFPAAPDPGSPTRPSGAPRRTGVGTQTDQLDPDLTQKVGQNLAIGSFINGQDPEDPPDAATTEWFNRVLNLIHLHAPTAKIILIRNPADALSTIERVLSAP